MTETQFKVGDLISWRYTNQQKPVFIGIVRNPNVYGVFEPMIDVLWMNKSPYAFTTCVVKRNAIKLNV